MPIFSFILYCVIITFTPGPATIMILAITQRDGVRSGLRYTYGATLAFFTLLVLSASLNSVLATLMPKVLVYMQAGGTLYIMYLAYHIYRMDVADGAGHKTLGFVSGFFTQFANPKVVLFTLTVLPTFVLPYDDSVRTVSLSVGLITVIGTCAYLTWVFFGAVFRDFLQKHAQISNKVMALGLLYAGVMIWV